MVENRQDSKEGERKGTKETGSKTKEGQKYEKNFLIIIISFKKAQTHCPEQTQPGMLH